MNRSGDNPSEAPHRSGRGFFGRYDAKVRAGEVVRHPTTGELHQITVEGTLELVPGLPPLIDLAWLLVAGIGGRTWRVEVLRLRDNRVMHRRWFRRRDSALVDAERQKSNAASGRTD